MDEYGVKGIVYGSERVALGNEHGRNPYLYAAGSVFSRGDELYHAVKLLGILYVLGCYF